jgi:predicted metal-dependent hydrolase
VISHGQAELPFLAEPRRAEVEVIRSKKRRKTVSASLVDGRIRVHIPSWMSKAEEEAAVASLVARIERQQRAEPVDLVARARALARAHDLPEPTSIKWVSNQSDRWGSCTPSSGSIRISDRMAGFPTWVIDAVVVHELAHLVEFGHGPAFDALVARFPKTERATGFLIAKGFSDGGDEGQ